MYVAYKVLTLPLNIHSYTPFRSSLWRPHCGIFACMYFFLDKTWWLLPSILCHHLTGSQLRCHCLGKSDNSYKSSEMCIIPHSATSCKGGGGKNELVNVQYHVSSLISDKQWVFLPMISSYFYMMKRHGFSNLKIWGGGNSLLSTKLCWNWIRVSWSEVKNMKIQSLMYGRQTMDKLW